MDPLVNTQSVDDFFDNPAAGSDAFGNGELAGDMAQPNGQTEFYQPQRAQEPTPQPGPQAPPAPDPDLPPEPSPTPDGTSDTPPIDYRSEYQRMQAELAELQLYRPLGELIKRNPNFLSAVEESLKTLPQAAPQAPQLVKPTVPVRPANFDPTEAFTVPGSESWKFREAQERFQTDMFDYYEKRDAQREEAQATAVREYEAHQQAQAVESQVTHELMTRYGYTPERVQDFIRTMSDPNSRSIANLVRLHQMQLEDRRTQSKQTVRSAQKNVPLPVGVTSGGGVGQSQRLTDSDAFNLGLLSAKR